MITVQFYFNEINELQTFLEKFPESKKYLEIQEVSGKRERTHKGWTKFEDEHIIDTYLRKSTKRIAEELRRTPTSVSQRIMKLKNRGLLKNKRQLPSRVVIGRI